MGEYSGCGGSRIELITVLGWKELSHSMYVAGEYTGTNSVFTMPSELAAD